MYKPNLSVIIPCFNEVQNIAPMIAQLEATLTGKTWEVVFVDDDSPDGTADEVRRHMQDRPNVRLVHRIGRRGLSGACIEGILSSTADLIAVMDADLQHDETKLLDMMDAFALQAELDICIGSRNTKDGSSGDGLSALRAWGSGLATRFSRFVLGLNVTDPMSGFFMVRRQSFNVIALDLQKQGFKILADMLSLSKGQWAVQEIPYIFKKRQHGESKMDSAIAFELMGLLVTRLTAGLLPVRFVLFLMVGASGVFVQYFANLVLLSGLGWPPTTATICGVVAAMTSNFWLNNLLTYRDRALHGLAMLRGLFSFYAICALGAVANVSVVGFVFEHTQLLWLATLAGASIAAVWNFMFSSFVTWRMG